MMPSQALRPPVAGAEMTTDAAAIPPQPSSASEQVLSRCLLALWAANLLDILARIFAVRAALRLRPQSVAIPFGPAVCPAHCQRFILGPAPLYAQAVCDLKSCLMTSAQVPRPSLPTPKAAPVPALDSWTARQRLKAPSFEQRATPLVMTRPLPAELQQPAQPSQQARCALQ